MGYMLILMAFLRNQGKKVELIAKETGFWLN